MSETLAEARARLAALGAELSPPGFTALIRKSHGPEYAERGETIVEVWVHRTSAISASKFHILTEATRD